MSFVDHDHDFEHAATLPQADSPPLATTIMCRRVDVLCGTRKDKEIAAQYGVHISAVRAMRHGIGLDRTDVDDGDTLRLVAKLAQETGASADWILGITNVVTPGPKFQQRGGYLTLQDKFTLLTLVVVSIILDIIIILLAIILRGL